MKFGLKNFTFFMGQLETNNYYYEGPSEMLKDWPNHQNPKITYKIPIKIK